MRGTDKLRMDKCCSRLGADRLLKELYMQKGSYATVMHFALFSFLPSTGHHCWCLALRVFFACVFCWRKVAWQHTWPDRL
ncbi:hypothetical protein TSUD_263900 [Trifolium subterraneum]|uniref:Uncharacterized protein n=1 Tax=Trifolium subterraneum TaxID=3900 RepID=A0A2Z6N090_TRISU|nr:hypothetical protein TSUD_263900 [Trifolium subterraneum]